MFSIQERMFSIQERMFSIQEQFTFIILSVRTNVFNSRTMFLDISLCEGLVD